MNRFVLKNTFIKIHIYYFLKYFYKNKRSKYRVAVKFYTESIETALTKVRRLNRSGPSLRKKLPEPANGTPPPHGTVGCACVRAGMHGSVRVWYQQLSRRKTKTDDDMDHAGSRGPARLTAHLYDLSPPNLAASVNTELIVVGFQVSATQGRHRTYVRPSTTHPHHPHKRLCFFLHTGSS